MNHLAHHYTISALNECIDMCNDASATPPDMTLADAVITLYLSYGQREHAQRSEHDYEDYLFHLETRTDEAARALLYYANNTDTRRLIEATYEILDNFDAQARALEAQAKFRGPKVVVTDLRSAS